MRAEVGAGARGGGRPDAVPGDVGEVAGERALAVEVGAVEVEGGPADYVVAGVRASAAVAVVDGEEKDAADPRVQRILNLGVVELGAGVGEVRADGEIVGVAGGDPGGDRVVAGGAVAVAAQVD